MPIGPKNKPTNNPTKLPHTPHLLPPKYLAPHAGKTLSNTCKTITTISHTIKKVKVNSIFEEK